MKMFTIDMEMINYMKNISPALKFLTGQAEQTNSFLPCLKTSLAVFSNNLVH